MPNSRTGLHHWMYTTDIPLITPLGDHGHGMTPIKMVLMDGPGSFIHQTGQDTTNSTQSDVLILRQKHLLQALMPSSTLRTIDPARIDLESCEWRGMKHQKIFIF
jgi:hypothetical protein